MPKKSKQKSSKVTKKTVKKVIKKVTKKKIVKKIVKKVIKKKVVKKVAKKTTNKKVIKKPVKKVAKNKVVKKTLSKKPTKQSVAEKKAVDLASKSEEMIEKGKKRGFVTYDEIIKVFPDIESNIYFLDELYEKLSVAGIDVLEGGNLLDMDGETEKMALKYSKDSPAYDSIQIYLKEIGQYSLISAADEKDLARRIEKGDGEAKNLLARANLR